MRTVAPTGAGAGGTARSCTQRLVPLAASGLHSSLDDVSPELPVRRADDTLRIRSAGVRARGPDSLPRAPTRPAECHPGATQVLRHRLALPGGATGQARVDDISTLASPASASSCVGGARQRQAQQNKMTHALKDWACDIRRRRGRILPVRVEHVADLMVHSYISVRMDDQVC